MKIATVQEAINGNSNDTAITPLRLKQVLSELNISSGGGGSTGDETDPVFKSSPAAGITTSNIASWNAKQDPLVSGQNIKTINGQDILGEGDITIDSGGVSEESDPTVPQYVKEITQEDIDKWNNPPTTDLSEYAKIEDIPINISELTNDSNYINQIKTINGETIVGEGNILIGADNTAFIDPVPISSIFDYDGDTVPDGFEQVDDDLDTNGIVNLIYPIGSLFINTSTVNPNVLFAGTKWERIKDTFLLAAGDKYELGATGGEEEVTLTVAQMPSHRHNIGTRSVYTGGGSYNAHTSSDDATGSSGANCSYVGGGQAHNNMPPYLSVYVWQRTE